MPNPPVDITLLSADYPIALLPVRIETRFAGTPPELRIRIYPDEIFADMHEPALTAVERAAGEAYWQRGWNPALEPEAWRGLCIARTPQRAAWIARALTPANLATRPAGTPDFPATPMRDTEWSRRIQTRVLPDCFTAIAYRGGAEVQRVVGNSISDELPLSFRPDAGPGDLADHDGLRLEPDLLWLIDFAEAEARGMAMRMSLTGDDLTHGFDRLVVVGARTSLTPAEGADRLAALLDAHHYTRGLSLVRQGTPTNNGEGARAGYPGPIDAETTWAIERDAPLAAGGGDGAAAALALGVPPAVFDHVGGADRREQENAGAMNRALWPCTLGYFLEQLMHPLVDAADLAAAREHFERHVRGRGPLPAFRISRVPYGLLPISATPRWETVGKENAFEAKLAELLGVWRQIFLTQSGEAPRVGRTSDPDADLLEVLGLDAAAREVRLRETFGPAFILTLFRLLAIDSSLVEAERMTMWTSVFDEAGLAGLEPRVKGLTWSDESLRFRRPLVATALLSETAVLSPNYIDLIREASVEWLRDSILPGSAQRDNPLLFHLLRQGALVEYNRIAVGLAADHDLADENDRREVELVRVIDSWPGSEPRKSPWQRFDEAIPAVTGSTELGKWLLEPSAGDPERQPIRDYRAALQALAGLPTAELDRLTAETLDLCSHRLDAWMTSLATRRLEALRAAHPDGIHLGAFGMVERLERRTSPRPGTAGGFIHAPSMAHAASAAVLRNAHLTRTGSARDQVAVDLSSGRVRRALAILDGVRGGQPPAALLGYRFERALHDHAPPLDRFIDRFRRIYPFGADPSTPPPAAGETIPARDVVNGLTLRAAWKATPPATIPWTTLGATAVERAGIEACLALLDSDVDAVADLLLAESVHQAVQGNPERSGAALSAAAGGGAIPEPRVVETPRTGVSYTQRVAIVLPGKVKPPEWGDETPRALAEPRLNMWAATLLGAPSHALCHVEYPDPQPGDPEHVGRQEVSLDQLGLHPVDLIALAPRRAELDARIEWHARTVLGIDAPWIAIDHDEPSEGHALLHPVEIARMLGEAIRDARPLAAQDLVAPGEAAEAPIDEDELADRVSGATAAAVDALDGLELALHELPSGAPYDLTALRTALWSASNLGVRGAVPANLIGDDDVAHAPLVAQGQAAGAELQRRINAAGAAADGIAALGALFGPDFVALPTFVPGNEAELEDAFADGPRLVGDADGARRWFQRAARVRKPLARLRSIELAGRALFSPGLDLYVAQLPHDPTARWNGSPIDASNPPHAGRLSLVVHRYGGEPFEDGCGGLVLDTWSELIPAREQTTGIAIHHDDPGAEAPQVVLVAVPPVKGGSWDHASLVDIVHEALDLARIRSVDADRLGDFFMLAPTIYCAGNVMDDTVQNDLGGLRMFDPLVMAPE